MFYEAVFTKKHIILHVKIYVFTLISMNKFSSNNLMVLHGEQQYKIISLNIHVIFLMQSLTFAIPGCFDQRMYF